MDWEFDITSVNNEANSRHIAIIDAAQTRYVELHSLYLGLMRFLKTRDLHTGFKGGISGLMLFYMVVGFLQNNQSTQEPLILQFFKFYADFDEVNYALEIDLTDIFEPQKAQQSPKIVQNPESLLADKKVPFVSLYIKNPVDESFYPGALSRNYRESVGYQASRYRDLLKPLFAEAAAKFGGIGHGVGWLFQFD
jgi:hypothetical protein